MGMLIKTFKSKVKNKTKFKVCYYNGWVSPTKNWQAIYFVFGRRSIWIFRNKQVYQGWPCCS